MKPLTIMQISRILEVIRNKHPIEYIYDDNEPIITKKVLFLIIQIIVLKHGSGYDGGYTPDFNAIY